MHFEYARKPVVPPEPPLLVESLPKVPQAAIATAQATITAASHR
jgi:hypothetical protein